MATIASASSLFSRRQIDRLGAVAGLSMAAAGLGAPLRAQAAGQASAPLGAKPHVGFPGGRAVSALGQGSWHLAQGRHPAAEEEDALQTGLDLGLSLIDTAEMYGSGRAESLIGKVIEGRRDQVFLVSKVLPSNATTAGIARACAASLKRLGTDHLDLYLLHWRTGSVDLAAVVPAFEALRAEGKIRAWGVSNFDTQDMEDLLRVPHGENCAANQVLYHLGSRGIEHALLPWCEKHGIPIMAYSPLGSRRLLDDATLARIGAAHGVSGPAVALAWAIRSGHVVAIPESGSPAHVKENAAALSLALTAADLKALDDAFPAPSRRTALDML